MPVPQERVRLFHVNGDVELAIGPFFDWGKVDPDRVTQSCFRIRNACTTPVAIQRLSIAGQGFTLRAPSLPVLLQPRMKLDFTVTFQATGPGAYSTPLEATGVSTLLLATVASHRSPSR